MFVHGFACDHTDWTAQVEALRDRHRVVTCDLRGHGSAPGEPDDCSIETYGADVAQLVEGLGLAPAILVGHSMGCRVVLEAARQRPQGVAGLVLVDGSITGTGDADAAERASRARIAAKGFHAFAADFFRGMFTVPFEGSEAIVRRASQLPARIGLALFPRIARWDAQRMNDALAAVQVPVLVIQSTQMNATLQRESMQPGQTSAWLDRVREHAPHARVEIVAGAGHFVHVEAAGRVNALLRDFLTE